MKTIKTIRIGDYIEDKEKKLIGYVTSIQRKSGYVYIRPSFDSFYYNTYCWLRKSIGLPFNLINTVNHKKYIGEK